MHKPAARPLKGRAGCRWCTEGASLLSFFLFSFPSFFFSKDSTPSLSPLLPLSRKLPLKLFSYHTQTLSILSQKHSNDPRKSTTKHFIQTNLPASILHTSTQYKPQETNENIKMKCKPR